MPRRSKGPRLYLRLARADKPSFDTWVIRDGAREISTGCDSSRQPEAEKALAAYIANKWTPSVASGGASDPAAVLISEVLALYLQERAPELAEPSKVADFVKPLAAWWPPRTVADVKRSTCKAYVEHRASQSRASAKTAEAKAAKISPQTARRELEVLSSAIGWWDKEHHLTDRPEVWLPEKAESPREALTRAQAAALLMAGRGYRRNGQTGAWERLKGSQRANRRHLLRFVLIGLYTGTRPGVIPKLLWAESPTSAFVDLADETIYRRGKAEKDHKTKRRPLVKMPPRLVQHMRRWRKRDLEAETPLLTVLHHGGRPIRGRIRTGFEGLVRDAGLAGKVTPHWMRHTCPTWLMEASVSTWDVAAYTGMSTAMLEKNYAHHRPSHQSAARQGFGRKSRVAGGISGGNS